ncbi:MAG: glycosyltransferase family 2 protein [Stellaceae bacterium]
MVRGGEQRPDLTAVVPCYNESKNIARTVDQIHLAARSAAIGSHEIVVVDDCSTDDTAAVVAGLARLDPRIVLVRNPRNVGFGGAYKEGVRHARGTYVIMVPGDNAHPHEGISPILRKAGEADIIIPYLANPEKRSKRRRVVSRTFTAVINLLFGLHVPYYNGLVLHKRDLLRTIEITTDSFAYQAEALVKLIRSGARYATVSVPISEQEKRFGNAFHLRNVYRVLKAIFDLWIKMRHFRAQPERLTAAAAKDGSGPLGVTPARGG